jgi:glycine cleavage system H protein
MSLIPDHLRYRESHEWVDSTAGETATCGISDHAQHELTDVVFVELPKVGRKVKAGEPVCTVESVKSANDVYAPVSGEVVEVNEALASDPSLVNRDPYGQGWMFKIKLDAASELAALLSPDAYQELCA